METFIKVCVAIGSALHWLTGFFVHPKKGGCCEMTAEDLKDIAKKEKE